MTDNLHHSFDSMVSSCLTCNQCSLACPTHIAGVFNPLGVLRDLQMNQIENAITNRQIYNCLTCNRCMQNCPMAGDQSDQMNMAEIIRQLREKAIKYNIPIKDLPVTENHTSILHSLTSNQEPQIQLPVVDVLSYFHTQSALKIASKGEIAYFVGCLPVLQKKNDSLGIEFDQIPLAVVKILNNLKITPVVLNLKCCGHDDYWAGRTEIFTALAKYNVDQYRKAGVKVIITACAEGYRTWKIDYPKIIPDFNFEVYHISEFLSKNNSSNRFRYKTSLNSKVTYQDPCRLGRMGTHLYDPPREMLKKIPGVSLIEMESNREMAQCCGCGINLQENDDTQRMWNKRLTEASVTGVDYLITSCPKCLAHFNYVIMHFSSTLTNITVPRVMDWTVFLSRYLL